MIASVQEIANTSRLYPRAMGNRMYEVKITHRHKYAYFYVFTGEGGMPLPELETALEHVASVCNQWSSWSEYKVNAVYPGGHSLHTARKLFVYESRSTRGLMRLLGQSSYEKFMRDWRKN